MDIKEATKMTRQDITAEIEQLQQKADEAREDGNESLLYRTLCKIDELVRRKLRMTKLCAAAPGMYSLLERLAGEMQVADSMGGKIGQRWLERRIKRINKQLAEARGDE